MLVFWQTGVCISQLGLHDGVLGDFELTNVKPVKINTTKGLDIAPKGDCLLLRQDKNAKLLSV